MNSLSPLHCCSRWIAHKNQPDRRSFLRFHRSYNYRTHPHGFDRTGSRSSDFCSPVLRIRQYHRLQGHNSHNHLRLPERLQTEVLHQQPRSLSHFLLLQILPLSDFHYCLYPREYRPHLRLPRSVCFHLWKQLPMRAKLLYFFQSDLHYVQWKL